MEKTPPKKRLLIVEDSGDLRLLLEALFVRAGYVVLQAENGLEALEILRAADALPDAIFLDITMPVMDGFGFRREQKADPRLAAIPVVIMTAHARDELEMRGFGAAEFLRKPIDSGPLLEVARRVTS